MLKVISVSMSSLRLSAPTSGTTSAADKGRQAEPGAPLSEATRCGYLEGTRRFASSVLVPPC